MATDLATHIQTLSLVDTHEHLHKEDAWVERGPDVLQDLFGHYPGHDLVSAGATPDAFDRLLDAGAGSVASRFDDVRGAWEAAQFTGYGEAVRLLADHVYDLPELTAAGLERAQDQLLLLRQPGERLRLLSEVARLDHVQVDDMSWPCVPDTSGPAFFLYDISWAGFCRGEVDVESLHRQTGVEVTDLRTLREALEGLFDRYGSCAIAVKAQHAYARTLIWQERSEDDAARALAAVLAHDDGVGEETRLCLGDWCWARGVELAIEHELPFKLHTGYYAGSGHMPVDRIRAGNLWALLARYPSARFVLMHIAYPYSEELVALAKHYPNVWVDLCWAWSINPHASADFVRRFIHAVPANKLFAFGGDTFWPTGSVAYSIQARRWLTRALDAEVDADDLTETQAIALATRLMRDNQYACFDLEGTRAAIEAEMTPHPAETLENA